MDRRAFLATPLVFGLRELLAQEPAAGPAWWTAALRRMKESGRVGVVLVAPNGPEIQRFGTDLAALLPGADPGVRRVLGQAVFIVLSPGLAGLVRRSGETFDRFLLDPDGNRLAADRVPPAAFAKPGFFAFSFRPFIEGNDGARLAERAAAQEAGFPADARRAIERLDDASPAVREEASAVLRRCADRYFPYLLQRARLETDVEVRGRLALVLDAVVVAAHPEVPGPALPYGVRRIIAEFPVNGGRDCAGCGLVIMTAPTRDFLECLRE